MEHHYDLIYPHKRISHARLLNGILARYPETDCDQPRTLDELLYIFDQKCPTISHKADRSKEEHIKADRPVVQELYRQCCDIAGKATLRSMAETYIENLETARLCLLRAGLREQELTQEIDKLPERQKGYVYLKLLQASVYSHFTGENCVSYKIVPSDIPPVTLYSGMDQLLKHEFVLQLQAPTFSIIFFESGVEICKWSFPDKPGLAQGQYTRNFQSENIDFNLQIKYLPKGSTTQKRQMEQNLSILREKALIEKTAFVRLCHFYPFLKEKQATKQEDASGLFGWLPWLKEHVRNLQWLLVGLLIAQSCASYFSSLQFIDIILVFYTLGILMDKSFINYRGPLLLLIPAYALCLIKSIWGTASPPFYASRGLQFPLLILCQLLKVFVIIAIVICVIKAPEVPEHRDRRLGGVGQAIGKERGDRETDIWESSVEEP